MRDGRRILSQTKLAKLAKVSPRTIANYEAGVKSVPGALIKEAIAKALKTTPETIFDSEGFVLFVPKSGAK